MKIAYLDFEFHSTNEPKLDLVSVCVKCTEDQIETYTRQFWLYRSKSAYAQAKSFFEHLIKEDYTFVSYVIEAEARALETLFGTMPSFKAIDLYLEYRLLLNHNHKYAYGNQYIAGKFIKTFPPKNKWDLTEESEEESLHHKPSYSLAAATYKLLEVVIDTDEKNEMRDIIISRDSEKITASAERILKYNASDINYLPQLLNKMYGVHRQCGESKEGFLKAAHTRGEYAVATAKMINLGYPINLTKLNAFTSNVSNILNSAIEDCIEHKEEVPSFRFNKKTQKYVATEKEIRAWITRQAKPYWRKTEKGKLSISKDAFRDWFDSDTPGFAGAYCRYLKTKQSLNGFMPASGSKRGTFRDYLGSDARVRPHFGIYGSQSSRSQPAATGYLWLKAKWMQNFLEAPKGKVLIASDFSSQEFLVAGIVSQDDNMIDSYASGDVYLAFGKIAGMIPKDGTKQTHRKEREICKTIILGLSYGMTSMGLAPRLTGATGETVTEDKAQEYITLFEESYPDYIDWKWQTLRDYEDNGFLQLSDGWTMWGDNDNKRSVTNFMVQGEGAVILRDAVKRLQRSSIDVIATVHDSIVIEAPLSEAADSCKVLECCMLAAFENVMSTYGRTVPIRVETTTWSTEYKTAQINFPKNVSVSEEFIDEKGKNDYLRYRKFFTATQS